MQNLPWVAILGDFQSSGPPSLPNAATSVGLQAGNGRSVESWTCSRGRSYELGGAQAGTATITVDDPEETLNPANTSSPLNSGPSRLALFRTVGIRAWWPREGNTLNAGTYGGTNPGFDPGFEGGTVNGWTATGGGSVTNVTTDPRSGTRCLRVALDGPTGEARAFVNAGAPLGPFTIPGVRATYSAWLRVATAGASARIVFGGQSSAAVTTNTWTRVSVSLEATRARTPLLLVVTGGPAGTASQIVFLDDEQLEFGVTTPGPNVSTGPVRYPVWTGYIERYPQEWVDQGFRGVRPIQCVDALSVLSRTIIRESYDATIAEDNPSLYLPFDDPSGPPKAQGRLAGRVRPTEFLADKGGSISWAADTLPDGTKAVTLSQTLQDPADVPSAEQFTGLDTRAGVVSPGLFTLHTGGATVEFWAKISASTGRVALQGIRSGEFKAYRDVNIEVDIVIGFQAFANGRMFMIAQEPAIRNAAAASADFTAPDSYLDDSQWHHFSFTFAPSPTDPNQYGVTFRFDGSERAPSPTNFRPLVNLAINSVHASASTIYGDPLSKISVARLAFYPRALSAARREAHYQRGVGFVGELASARAARLLSKWWKGAFRVDEGSGLTLPSDHGYTGGSVLSALESITTTDDATLYADSLGSVVVESSLSRHQPAKRTGLVFGEAAGELPYDGIEYDFDPTYVYSHISVSRPGRSSPIELVDSLIEQQIGQRVFSRSVDVTTDFELMQTALYLQRRYGTPRLRVRRLTLRPDTNPALWPVVLTLDVSQRITIRRRTRQGTVIEGDYYIESINHAEDVSESTWTVDIEASPAPIDRAWVLGDPTTGTLGTRAVPVY